MNAFIIMKRYVIYNVFFICCLTIKHVLPKNLLIRKVMVYSESGEEGGGGINAMASPGLWNEYMHCLSVCLSVRSILFQTDGHMQKITQFRETFAAFVLYKSKKPTANIFSNILANF